MPEPRDNWKAEEQAHYEEELKRYNDMGILAGKLGYSIPLDEDDVQPDHVVQQPKKGNGVPDEED